MMTVLTSDYIATVGLILEYLQESRHGTTLPNDALTNHRVLLRIFIFAFLMVSRSINIIHTGSST